jgi:hypothetical protein
MRRTKRWKERKGRDEKISGTEDGRIWTRMISSMRGGLKKDGNKADDEEMLRRTSVRDSEGT